MMISLHLTGPQWIAKTVMATKWYLIAVVVNVLQFKYLQAEHVNVDNFSQVANVSVNESDSSIELISKLNPISRFDAPGISKLCNVHLREFWNALRREEPWAVRMYDATGRYNSKLFFGQNFWLGSHSLCQENARISRPYDFTFHVAKLYLKMNESLMDGPRIVYLGLCLPNSCLTTDTHLMISTNTNEISDNKTLTLKVLNVRVVPSPHSVFSNFLFYALGGFTSIVSILVIVSTVYECCTVKKQSERTVEPETNNNINGNEDKNTINSQHFSSSEHKRTSVGLSSFILSFSMKSNFVKIFSTSNSSRESFSYIHGLRFLTLCWVILVHTYLQLFAISGNKFVRVVTERSFLYSTVGNATYSVDTFFFISGFLMTSLWKTLVGKNFTLIQILVKYLAIVTYRVIRLTPVYLIILGMFQFAMTFIQHNSVFEPNILDTYNCAKYWWRNALYINNFYPREEMCMLWSWYLAVDTQFFVFSAVFLLIALRRFKLALGIELTILFSSWCTTALISYANNYQARIEEPLGMFDALYDKPWTRIGPHIIGLGTGIFIHKNEKFSMTKVAATFGWIFSTAGFTALVFGLGLGIKFDVTKTAIYVSLGHTIWGCCLAWIVIACHFGYGGIISSILSAKAFHPLSRLTFCAYLAHPLIMVLTSYVMDGPFHIHNGLIVIIFLGNVVASYMLSIVLSLLFEAPTLKITKLLLR